MADKFEKLSIYNVDFKIKDRDDLEHTFTFKPLPFSRFPEVFEVVKELQGLSKKATSTEEMFQYFTSEFIEKLAELEVAMVKRSYPEMDDDKVQGFVQSNLFDLVEPLVQTSFKQ